MDDSQYKSSPCNHFFRPMNNTYGWGSQPIPGRDWGTSCRCDEEVMTTLRTRLQVGVKAAGVEEEACDNTMPLLPSVFDFSTTDMDVSPRAQIQDTDMAVQPLPTPEQTADARALRRRKESNAKRNRVSLCAAALQYTSRLSLNRKSLFPSSFPEASFRSSLLMTNKFALSTCSEVVSEIPACPFTDRDALALIFDLLEEGELLCTAGLVFTAWADASATAHANRMLASVGYLEENDDDDDQMGESLSSLALSMECSWASLVQQFPWGCFLSEGSFKQVYRVHNKSVGAQEAVSVMDIDAITDKKTVGAELAVSSLLSSLARRGICPNFIITRGVFTCPYAPPASTWGSSEMKQPKGSFYDADTVKRAPREPKNGCPGRYQYIRMELCSQGDTEEYLKRQPKMLLSPRMSQVFLFQIAFALHASAERFSLKHYDLKMLNVFVQEIQPATESVVLRYALGSHTFSLRMDKESAVFAKLADYGTANISAESNGQPVTIAQFTTLENTPPDFMLLGDEAHQGHGHDNFGLGLCMLHLFTGNAPYEEILEEVVCPLNLKKRLRAIWENESVNGYDAIRSVVLSDVYKDEAGNIVEGEPDEILYDTLYRFLVLFGIPDRFEHKKCPLVWKAIAETLQEDIALPSTKSNQRKRKKRNDVAAYHKDCRQYSILEGSHPLIAQARYRLEGMPGAMDLLFSLCHFDPMRRSSAMDVLNSVFMENLRETGEYDLNTDDATVYNFTAFATTTS